MASRFLKRNIFFMVSVVIEAALLLALFVLPAEDTASALKWAAAFVAGCIVYAIIRHVDRKRREAEGRQSEFDLSELEAASLAVSLILLVVFGGIVAFVYFFAR